MSRNVQHQRLAATFAFVIAPVLAFYAVLCRYSQNFPEMDDYDAILNFASGYVQSRSFAGKLSYLIASQHVVYKLWFEHLVVVAQLALVGHINFAVLQQLGNLFLFPIVAALWWMFRPPSRSLQQRLLLFAPVVFLLFAPRYEETLDWAMGGLQNLPVLAFSLVCACLVGQRSRVAFAGACLCELLAIASSLNGFAIAMVGVAVLAQQRKWGRAVVVAMIATLCLVLYAFHYTRAAGTPHVAGTPDAVAHHAAWLVVLLPVAFLGAALGKAIAVGVGAALIACLVALRWKRWIREGDPLWSATWFVLLTAVALGVARHDQGLKAAFASRYTLYSQLLISLVYLTIVNHRAAHLGTDRRTWRLFWSVTCGAVLFCSVSQIVEFRKLHRRLQATHDHFVAWSSNPEKTHLIPDETTAMPSQQMRAFQSHAEQALRGASSLGLYSPPAPGAR